jgi:putative DNA primase/helicase
MLGIFPAWFGDVVSAHRTFLDPRGEGKLPGLPSRKLFGSIKPKLLGGSAIRIGVPVDGVMGIAEGVETAMAVTQLTGEVCWSALNTTLLEQFQVPEGLGITAVNIYADKDRSEAGQRAGKILARRLHAEGYKVEYRLPVGEIEEGTKSLDFADLALTSPR